MSRAGLTGEAEEALAIGANVKQAPNVAKFNFKLLKIFETDAFFSRFRNRVVNAFAKMYAISLCFKPTCG